MSAPQSVSTGLCSSGVSYAGITVKGSSNTVNLSPCLSTKIPFPSNFKGYIESAGAVAIEAQHFVIRRYRISLVQDHANLGRTLSGMILWPVTLPSQTTATGPSLDYSFTPPVTILRPC